MRLFYKIFGMLLKLKWMVEEIEIKIIGASGI